MRDIPNLTFSNGRSVPQLGLGTWQSTPELLTKAIEVAIEAGYRHFDCAYVYQNEAVIGSTLKRLIKNGKVTRDELFITTKLWCTFHSKEKVNEGFSASLKALDTPYVDLLLVHAPYGMKEGTNELFPQDEQGQIICSEVDFIETYLEMEKLVGQGLVRSLGISNFNSKQTKRILDVCSVKPVTNQVEVHPYLINEKLRKFSMDHGIFLTAYAPLGSPGAPFTKGNLLSDDKVCAIAKFYDKTPGQILIRFALERGIIVIPKSTNPARIQENINIFDFALSNEDLKELPNLNNPDGRIFKFSNVARSKYYPFSEEF